MKNIFNKSIIVLCCCFVVFSIVGWVERSNNDETAVSVVSEKVLIPGGQSVGVKMDVKGVLVVGLEEIPVDENKTINPGILSGLQIGDMILEINGREVYSAEEVKSIINEIKDVVYLKIKRNNDVMTVTIDPVKSAEDGLYKMGIWVKDKTAGIGTLTYYDPVNATFGALGHGIVDPETNSILSVDTGLMMEAQVQEVEEGKNGAPGEIKGIFYRTNDPIGSLTRNCEYGIFGNAYHPIENSLYNKPLAVGCKEQVELGKAHILSTLTDNEVERYEIEIEKINEQDKPAGKSMVIKVTDKELLEESGGIVQGMSGSPIIQNNRIIGAVTHVFLNDPTKGYGVFIEWMLQESNFVDN